MDQLQYVREKAADILEQGADDWESGKLQWVQHRFGTADTGLCAVGMCRYQMAGKANSSWDSDLSDGEVFTVSTAINMLSALLIEAGHNSWVPSWNDTDGRTQEEVIELFKQASKELRNHELESRSC